MVACPECLLTRASAFGKYLTSYTSMKNLASQSFMCVECQFEIFVGLNFARHFFIFLRSFCEIFLVQLLIEMLESFSPFFLSKVCPVSVPSVSDCVNIYQCFLWPLIQINQIEWISVSHFADWFLSH